MYFLLIVCVVVVVSKFFNELCFSINFKVVFFLNFGEIFGKLGILLLIFFNKYFNLSFKLGVVVFCVI